MCLEDRCDTDHSRKITLLAKKKNIGASCTFPFSLRAAFGRALPVQSSHQRHHAVVVNFEVSAALRAELSQVRVKELRPVV